MKAEMMLAAVVTFCLLAGCGGREDPPDLAKSQRQAIEKAKSVEQTLQQSADRQR